MPYTVRDDDNYHYTHGEFPTWQDALNAAQHIVDGFLASAHTPGMTPKISIPR
jgi:hypothetical protein